jgi:hypothetical protein
MLATEWEDAMVKKLGTAWLFWAFDRNGTDRGVVVVEKSYDTNLFRLSSKAI